MWIVCWQTIHMEYQAVFVILKKWQNWKCRLLQIKAGALWVNNNHATAVIKTGHHLKL